MLNGLRNRLARMLATPAYESAASGPRTRSMVSSSIGPSAAIASNGDTLRNRSRHLTRNNPWAYGAIQAFSASAIGTGIKPRSKHPDEATRKALNALWLDWTDEAVSEGIGDLYAAQLVAANTLLEGGDCLVRLRPRRLEDGLTVPLQVNVYDGAMLPYWHTTTAPNGNRILCGIEFDVLGRKVAYWMHKQHPGEQWWLGTPSGDQLERIPASQMLHLFDWRVAGQIRGEASLARAAIRLNDLDEHDQAELCRKKAAARISMVIETPTPDDLPGGIGMPVTDEADASGGLEVTLQPDTVPILRPGERINTHAPADVGPNFEVFIEHQLRGIAKATGVTFEQLTGNYTRVNYSSGRLGALEHRRQVEPWQYRVMVYQCCRPLWRAFVDAAVLSGAVRIPGFARTPRDAYRATWHPQGWPWVDPLKDQQAALMGRQMGVTSLSRIAAEQGEDWEEIAAEIKAENDLLDRLGIKSTADARNTVTTPGAAATVVDEDEDEAPPRRAASGGRRGA